jgi:hypothetical protein
MIIRIAPHRYDPVARVLAHFALAAVVIFTLVCGAVQFLRSDLDPLRAPLSFFLTGDYGAFVRAAYYALAAGLVALGIAAYRTSNPARRSAAPLLLFVIAGIALVPVAVTELFATDGGAHAAFARYLHGVAAETTFICVTVAILLQSLWWRRDPAFVPGRVARIVLSFAAFAMLWVNALLRIGLAGLMQKVLIALILAWLALAAWQTQRASAR